MMIPDPTAEMKRIRHQLGADAEFDLGRIFDDLRRQRKTSKRTYIRLPGRKPTDNNAMHRSSGEDVSGHGESTAIVR